MEATAVERQQEPTLAELIDKHSPKREAEPTTSTGQSEPEVSPADPNVAPEPAKEPEARFASMEDRLPEDFEHGFFRGKPLKEFFHSFKATEAEMQRAQRAAKEAADAAERYRIESIAKDVAVQMAAEQRVAAQPPPDPFDEVENLWFENPRAAAAKLQELTLAQARQLTQTETQKVRQETEAEARKRQMLEQGAQAYDAARTALKLEPDTWNRRAKAVLVEITDPQSQYYERGGPLNQQNYLDAYRDLYGDMTPAPVAPVVVTPAPVPANPPGAKKPATTAPQSNAGLPTADSETRKGWRKLAERVGADPDSFVARMESSLAAAQGGRRA